MGFFEQMFGTDLSLPARAIVALVLVLALIALTVWLMRRFGDARIGSNAGGRGRQQRLAVLDSAVVDARRRLVLIRRDNIEHLLLIGGPTDVVVEPNIVRGAPLAAGPRARVPEAEAEPESPLIPTYEPSYEPEPRAPEPRPIAREPARPAAAPPMDAPRTMPRPAQRMEPQYADMAQKLEAALRKPPAPEPEVAQRTPPPAPAAPRAPEPRAPEPRPVAERTFAPQPRAPERPAQRAPEPRVPEPRPVERPAPPPAAAPAPAPAPAQQTAADVFGNLEEEMASLLRPGGKPGG